jgi:LysM repeat protein
MRSRNWGLTAGIALVIGAVLLGIVLIWRAGPETSGSVTPTTTQQAAAVPSPSPIPSPTAPRLVTYTVQEGDTLSGIAQAYDISLEQLIGANDIANPDFLQIGQTLVIPQGETANPITPASTAAPGETSSAEEYDDAEFPTLTPSGPALVEVSNVLNAGDLTVETIILENRGGTVSLDGWTLSTAVDDTFVFPPLTLFTGGTVQVHSANGEDAPRDLYWGRTEPAWEAGGLATLRDADGNIVDTYIVPES